MRKTFQFPTLAATTLRVLALSLPAPLALGQAAFPAKNIQLIVPYPAGGSIDIISRAVGQKLGESWGRNVVVENRAGASGMIGTEVATKAAEVAEVWLRAGDAK